MTTLTNLDEINDRVQQANGRLATEGILDALPASVLSAVADLNHIPPGSRAEMTRGILASKGL